MDESDSEETEAEDLNQPKLATGQLATKKKMLISMNKKLCSVLDRIDAVMVEGQNATCQQKDRPIDPAAVSADDFECSICSQLFWEPVTVACGHTFCRGCIDRVLDHKRECPMCKTQILTHHRLPINEFVDASIKRLLPAELALRRQELEEELREMGGRPRQDGGVTIPVFVCTISFPNIPCPLHVFEPKYRLMIRRAMESGSREFGMCAESSDQPFSDYGTMLEIRDIKYFPDGRSAVDTVGGRRFRVVDRDTKDGYNTATVHFIKDEHVAEDLLELQGLHHEIHAVARTWFDNHGEEMKEGIVSHYGAMPAPEPDYWELASGPAWPWWVLAILPVDAQLQQQILSQTSLKLRLKSIRRILTLITAPT